MGEPSQTPVLYIAGTGRSGSTLLARVLGEVEGVFTAGELRYFWQRGLIEQRKCGCGVPVPECPLWHDVIERSAFDGDTVQKVVRLLRQTGRIRHLPSALRGAQLHRLIEGSAGQDAVTALQHLYQHAAAASGARVIVDSSKLPSYGRLLREVPGIDLRVVHMVRDPRAAAYSWASRKQLTDGGSQAHMEQIGAGKSAVLWSIWNSTTGRLFERQPEKFEIGRASCRERV